ncbi:MAG: hypothetical protein U0990_10805 [Candidatus Nanopelagicales bacterium]|nr:hypothetical protein [Candidatus Nanopelagicales bacterium]MDZ4250555.1 hypothetical protein [Candidatus Nanopelagicales bacterium]
MRFGRKKGEPGSPHTPALGLEEQGGHAASRPSLAEPYGLESVGVAILPGVELPDWAPRAPLSDAVSAGSGRRWRRGRAAATSAPELGTTSAIVTTDADSGLAPPDPSSRSDEPGGAIVWGASALAGAASTEQSAQDALVAIPEPLPPPDPADRSEEACGPIYWGVPEGEESADTAAGQVVSERVQPSVPGSQWGFGTVIATPEPEIAGPATPELPPDEQLPPVEQTLALPALPSGELPPPNPADRITYHALAGIPAPDTGEPQARTRTPAESSPDLPPPDPSDRIAHKRGSNA